MKKLKITAAGTLVLALVMSLAVCGGSPSAKDTASSGVQAAQPTQTTQAQPASLFWIGDGGKGSSITILPPKGSGLAKDQAYLPELVANELVSNLGKFSGMKLFDRVNLTKQYDELLSGIYADDDAAGLDLGHLTSTDYMLVGTITRTSSSYALQLSVNSNIEKKLLASYSSVVSIADLDNLTAVRRASLELLEGLGIQPTDRTRTELTKAATTEQANAQNALAQGIVAQREGTVVQALSRYIQANNYDPALAEAASRLNILAANVSSGNIGEDVRNDIQWRDQWVARLKECEAFYLNYMKDTPPYYLVYSPNIKQGDVDYDKGTVPLTMESIAVYPEISWFSTVDRVVQTVREGLMATGRADTWKLAEWPLDSISAPNIFSKLDRRGWSRTYVPGFWVEVELANSGGKSLGKNTVWLPLGWDTVIAEEKRVYVLKNAARPIGGIREITFPAVNARDIIGDFTIRITNIDGINAQTTAERKKITILTSSDFENLPAAKALADLKAGNANVTWAFPKLNRTYDRYTTFLASGRESFSATVFHNTITSIRDREFQEKGSADALIIPNSVTSIGESAFDGTFSSITIGANVRMVNTYGRSDTSLHSFLDNSFIDYYNNNGRKAGTYTLIGGKAPNRWIYSAR